MEQPNQVLEVLKSRRAWLVGGLLLAALYGPNMWIVFDREINTADYYQGRKWGSPWPMFLFAPGALVRPVLQYLEVSYIPNVLIVMGIVTLGVLAGSVYGLCKWPGQTKLILIWLLIGSVVNSLLIFIAFPVKFHSYDVFYNTW